jgi:hypothetical protein
MADAIPGMEAVDLGDGTAATYYSDGSVVIWNITSGEKTGGWGPQPNQVAPEGSPGGPAPQGAWGAAAPQAPAAPSGLSPYQPTGPVGTRRPGEPFNYGTQRPGAGVYPGAFGAPGGGTVSASTRNPAMPSQGRSEGWGSIGANTAGIPYGWGVPGFGQNPIPIREEYLDNLFNQQQAPGYIGGSGTYNQYRLDQPGLFGTLPGQAGEVNLRYGLGGTGDPTTGHEIQTPERWITGDPASSSQAMQGDDYARGVRPLPGR